MWQISKLDSLRLLWTKKNTSFASSCSVNSTNENTSLEVWMIFKSIILPCKKKKVTDFLFLNELEVWNSSSSWVIYLLFGWNKCAKLV